MSPRSKENWFEVREIGPKLFGLAEPGHYEEVNSFLLIGESAALLIDTGMGVFSMKSAVDAITSLPVFVINTHSHFDHVGGNYEFSNVAMYECAESREVANSGFSAEFLAHWTTDEQLWGMKPEGFPNPYTIPPFELTEQFSDGSIIEKAPFSIEVIHTPGHSDDSVCFYEKNGGWLFTGDLLYDGPIYIERNGGLSKFRKSIKKISALRNLTAMYSSHNYFEFQLSKFEKLSETLSQIGGQDLDKEVIIEDRLKLVPC